MAITRSKTTTAASSQPGILIVSQYDLPSTKRNMNAYQRVLFGGRRAPVHLVVRRKAQVSSELQEVARVHYAPVHHRWLFLIYAVLFAGRLRFCGVRAVLTEPSGFAAVGLLTRILFGYRWVLDVWDRPRWRTGEHESGRTIPLSDRLVFWMMRYAHLYLLSVLPRAAKDIRFPPERALQLRNAIDLSVIAPKAPTRSSAKDATLHVAFGRSKFWGTQGLDIMIRAAEKLKYDLCPVHFHLIGEMPEEERARITNSPVRTLFTMHGFLESGCIPLYRTIHVGLVPYPPFEDLSYIFPIKVLEHLSQGNPVIATRLPGLCEMVKHEHNGLIVEPGDATALAEAIGRLQRDPALYDALARNALASIRQFDVEAKHDKIFGAIRSCCSAADGRLVDLAGHLSQSGTK